MKTKEEVIKEAWGNISDKINKDGWLYFGYACNGWDDVQDWLESNKLNSDRNYYDMKYDQCDNGDLICVEIRPKSLKGIENNNGWIRIKSEDDLPKDGYFWIRKSDGHITLMSVLVLKSIPKKRYSEITHYQPIIKPEKPLF